VLTQRTKRQLLAFVFITLVGISYVGARYARLDKLVYDSSYDVHTHLAQSGGIFVGAEVTYRGVGIGQVSDMRLIDDGVDVVLDIENKYDEIPADTLATVGNKSAVGEQYVELAPKTDGAPYLKAGSVIEPENTAVPVSTTEILTNLDRLITSVPQDTLRTVVDELGAAFQGTGDDLAQIIDTSNAFIATANENFDITTSLIRQSNTVLRTQAEKGSAIRSFARDLALFTGTLAENDDALRALIDNGSATANELRTFLELNQVDLGSLINNLVTTGEIIVQKLPGIRQVLAIYPYMVANGYTVTAKNSDGYNARFGLILNQDPAVCEQGYDPAERRSPTDGDTVPMDEDARCTDTTKNHRGSRTSPRPPVATVDLDAGTTTWSDQDPVAAGAPYSDQAALTYLLFRPLS